MISSPQTRSKKPANPTDETSSNMPETSGEPDQIDIIKQAMAEQFEIASRRLMDRIDALEAKTSSNGSIRSPSQTRGSRASRRTQACRRRETSSTRRSRSTDRHRRHRSSRSRSHDRTRRERDDRHRRTGHRARTSRHSSDRSRDGSRERRRYSSSDDEPERREAIDDLLKKAGNTFTKKRGKRSLLPHTYAIRGNQQGKVGLGESAWHEHIAALFRMSTNKAVPAAWTEHLLDHVNQLAIMAGDWDWTTCRTWSEKVFNMFDDGRLPRGWSDKQAIKDVQRDACLVGATAYNKQHTTRHDTYRYTQSKQEDSNVAPRGDTSQPAFKRADFNTESDGRPCSQWNWGRDCGFSASHGSMPDRMVHVCAWCANKYKKANVHKEQDCNNKKRQIERKAAASTSDQPDGERQDFR